MARKGYKCKTIVLPDGTRKYIYGKTKEEVEQKYIEACIQLRAGVDLKNHDTFGEFAQMWFNTCKRGTVSPATEDQIKRNLNNYVMPKLASYRMQSITPMMCAAIFKDMNDKNKGAGLQRMVRMTMKNIFDVAVENGVIAKSPITASVQASGRKNPKRRALEDRQIKQVLEACRDEAIEPFVIIALYAGLRRGEIYGLQWEDVDMEKMEFKIRHNCRWYDGKAQIMDFGKTNAARRTIPFGEEVKAALDMRLQDRRGPCVFHVNGKPYTEYLAKKDWSAISRLGYGHDLTPHILRHTAITKWLAAGMDIKEVQYLAGHASVQTTLGVYADYLPESRMSATRAKVLNAYA